MSQNASRAPSAEAMALSAALVELVTAFAGRLRWIGLDLSIVELTDALRAVQHGGLDDRDRLRRLLRITMVKRSADIAAFDTAFDLFFPAATADAATGQPGDEPHGNGIAAEPGDPPARDDLLNRLVAALRGEPGAGMRVLAGQAVAAFAGLGSGQVAGSERYYQYRVLRQLDISELLMRAMRLEEQAGSSGLERRLTAIEQRERLQDLRAQIAAELQWQLAGLGGAESSLEHLRESIADVEFLRAGPAELAAMRRTVRPLARRLAAAARRRRRLHSEGRLNVRRTLRRAVADGGVPLHPVWLQRRRSRPQLIVLCDVSGSVAEFAKFTLSLLHALHAELPRLRSFVFADGLAEVTDLVRGSPGVIDSRLLLSRPGVVRRDGHSDYGSVLRQFLDAHGRELSRDCVLLICGDARGNYRAPRADLLHALRQRVRRVHWLNPEPRAQWDTTDSTISRYSGECDTVREVRNLRQLGEWVDTLL
jgi:uncharacterized protein with von Willebrand factor type A (vWA) domain